jgi:6-phosphogluconolactonase
MIKTFKNSDELAAALADYVVTALAHRIERDGQAVLAVSGGTTPIKFFQALSAAELDWQHVTVTLVDDRWVPESSLRSNARLIRQHLLQNKAAEARFVPLITGHDTPEEALGTVQAALNMLALPFAVVVLGAGTDGHTASLFPNGDRLAAALAPADGQLVESMRCEAAGEPRVTLTLPALLAADRVVIHVEGQTKWHVLEAAHLAGPVEDMPIRAVLAHDPPPDVFWCP